MQANLSFERDAAKRGAPQLYVMPQGDIVVDKIGSVVEFREHDA
jgi:hypothetical protein